MRMSGQKGFEGWYFKHQKGDDMVAFIPGRAESGDFIQLISREGARQFQVSDLTVRNGMIQADRCWFSSQGCHIELPGITPEDVNRVQSLMRRSAFKRLQLPPLLPVGNHAFGVHVHM